MQADITFAIPYYQNVEYLRVAVESVFAQSHERWRLLVCDDSGGDPAADALLRSYSDERVEYHRNPANLGMVILRPLFSTRFAVIAICFVSWPSETVSKAASYAPAIGDQSGGDYTASSRTDGVCSMPFRYQANQCIEGTPRGTCFSSMRSRESRGA